MLFDQRGAGRSHPYLATDANTTQHLVADIERIRVHFGFDKMLIVGGSWGSTLALAYAETYPERVSGLVLRAVFLGTAAEVDWAFRRAPQQLRPDLYENFVAALPESERDDPLSSYVARLTERQSRRARTGRAALVPFERILSEFLPGDGNASAKGSPTPAAYRRRRSSRPTTSPMTFSLRPAQLLDGASRLGSIPGRDRPEPLRPALSAACRVTRLRAAGLRAASKSCRARDTP